MCISCKSGRCLAAVSRVTFLGLCYGFAGAFARWWECLLQLG